MNVPQWVKDAAGNVAAGVGAVSRGIVSLARSTWAGMSPEAKSLTIGLAIWFGLGAFTVGMLL